MGHVAHAPTSSEATSQRKDVAMSFGNYPDIDTALGRAWMRAASISQSLLSNTHDDIDPRLREYVQQLAHGQKVLCEYVEQLREHSHSHGR